MSRKDRYGEGMPESHASSNTAGAAIGRMLGLVVGLLAVSTFAGILMAAFLLPAVTAASGVAKDGVDLFESLPSQLEVEPLNEASRIEAADGSLLATFYSENRIMVPLEDIDKDLQNAVIAVEDRRFYQHNGVDFQGTARAFASNASGGDTQGGSTLTQQYVKNALLMDAFQRNDEEAMKKATETTYVRKLREAKLAISLEKKMSKAEILQGYLNLAQFGPSQYGVETAAQHYFSKSAKDLNPGEAALLAGITNSPNANDPVAHPEAAKKRQNTVLFAMKSQGYISEADYKKYTAQNINELLKVKNVRAGCADAQGSGFFCDYVTRSLLADPNFAPTFEERRDLLYGGGLTIKTTLDPGKQKLAMEIVNRRVPATSESGFGHTIVTTEPGTGRILAMAQNRNFNPFQGAKRGETSINYNVPKNLGGGTGFPVGSTFKPFVLTQYLKNGGSIWDSVKTNREKFTTFPAKCLPSGRWFEKDGWDPDNAVSVRLGPTQTILDATKFSVNTSYARIARSTDLCDIAATARTMGVVPAYFDDSTEEAAKAPIQDVFGANTVAPSVLALGQLNVSQLDMAAAYATFAAHGKFCTPVGITQVLDRNGKKLNFTGSTCSQVLEPKVADAVAWTLKQDLEDPRATGMGKTIPGHDAGGKTGTSTGQFHTWYVGFTGQMSTAVWFGSPSGDVSPGGFNVDDLYLRKGHVWGNTVSLPTWQEFMTRASEGMPNIPFPPEPPRPPKPKKPEDDDAAGARSDDREKNDDSRGDNGQKNDSGAQNNADQKRGANDQSGGNSGQEGNDAPQDSGNTGDREQQEGN